MNATPPFIFGMPQSNWRAPLERYGFVLDHAITSTDACDVLFIPSDYADIQHAGRHPQRFPRRFCPSAAVASLVAHPLEFSNWMNAAGFAHLVPKRMIHERTFPLVLKEDRISSGGEAVHLIADDAELDRVTDRLRYAGIAWLLTEPVYGMTEFVAHQLVLAGCVVHSIVFAVQLSHPLQIKRGSMGGTVTTAVDLSPLASVYRALDYTGFACVNFKARADGSIAIFEINPRLGGSLVVDPSALADMMAAFTNILPLS